MTAEIDSGFPRDRVLSDASVSPEQWELTQETWLLRIAKQGAQRKLALVDRYNELLAKHRKTAQRKMRAEKRKHKGPMPVAPEAHLSPLARAGSQDGSGATFQQPGFAGAAERPSFAASASSFVQAPPAAAAPSAWASDQPAFVAQAPTNVPLFADTLDDDDGGEFTLIVPDASDPANFTPAAAVPFNAGVSAPKVGMPDGANAPRPSAPSRPQGSTLVNMSAADLEAKLGPAWLGKNPQGSPAASPQPAAGLPFQAHAPQAQAAPAPVPSGKAAAGLPFQTRAAEAQAAAAKAPAGLPFQAHAAEAQAAAAKAPAGLPFQAQAPAQAAATKAPAGLPFQAQPQAAPSGGLPFQGASAPTAKPSQPHAVPVPGAGFGPGASAGLPFQSQPAQSVSLPSQTLPAAVPPAGQTTAALPFQAQAVSKTGLDTKTSPKGAPLQPTNVPPAHGAQVVSGGLPFQQSAAAAPKVGAPVAGLPFHSGAASPAKAPPGAAAPAPAHPQQSRAPVPASPQAPKKEQAPQQVSATRLTVEQLAWLQAQAESSPDLARAAREKLGMSEADVARERAAWQLRFQNDRALVERYSQVFYHYRRGPTS